jgi:hypothetical protein
MCKEMIKTLSQAQSYSFTMKILYLRQCMTEDTEHSSNVSYAQISKGQNPMCDPNDTHVNGIESRTYGIPKTPSSSSSSSSSGANSNTATMTNTGAEVIAPATTLQRIQQHRELYQDYCHHYSVDNAK